MAGIDQYTIALLHFDDSAIKDECGNKWTVKSRNNKTPVIDSSISKFGSGSLYINQSGSIYTNEFNFGTEDFTIDFWIRLQERSDKGYQTFFCNGTIDNGANPGVLLIYYSNGIIYYYMGNNLVCKHNITPSTEFQHISAQRKNKYTWFMSVNGDVITANWPYGMSYANSYFFLSDYNLVNYDRTVNAHIDELRISKGIARWTENFDPNTNIYNIEKYDSYKDDNDYLYGYK